jgi:hypothetical protein
MHSTRWWLTISRGKPLPDRDRPSEFVAETGGDAELLEFFDRMVGECQERLEPADPFDPAVTREVPDDDPVTAAWALLHALEHIREHVAQAQLTRQLWERQA